MDKSINILAWGSYIVAGGIETYNYEIMKHYNDKFFLYWTISKANIKYQVREKLDNVKETSLMPERKRKKCEFINNLSIFWRGIMLLILFRKFKIKNQETWFIFLNLWLIFVLPVKFFKNNHIYLFQHSEIKIPIFLRIIFLKKNIDKKINYLQKFHIFTNYDKTQAISKFKINNGKIFSFSSIIPTFNTHNTYNRKYNLIFIGRNIVSKRMDKFLEIINYKLKNLGGNIIVGAEVPNVCSFKNLKREKLFEILSMAKFLVVTSDSEGQSLVIWEALSQNTQVIIFNNSPVYNFYKNFNSIHFAKTISDVHEIADNWKEINCKPILDEINEKYGYFYHNKYI